MANSLRCKLKRLNYTGAVSNDDYKEIMDKLAGHDRTVYNMAIDDFVKECLELNRKKEPIKIKTLGERLKARYGAGI